MSYKFSYDPVKALMCINNQFLSVINALKSILFYVSHTLTLQHYSTVQHNKT